MSAFQESLVGRSLAGVVDLSPRSLALGLGGRPRSYLWVHLERKEATYTLSETLPTAPDPRGSRYAALEEGLRGLRILDALAIEERALVLSLAPADQRVATHTLTISAEGARTNLILARKQEGTILWAYHRDPSSIAAGQGPAPPAGFQRPRVRWAESPESHEALRTTIARSFQEDFERALGKALNDAERALEHRREAQGGDLARARAHGTERRWGEILLTHYNEIPRGASRVRLPDTFADSPGATVEIPLDPALSPHDNAARLFQRARKGERGEKLVEARLARTRKSLAGLQGLRRDITSQPPKEALQLLDGFLREADLRSVARGDIRKIRLERRAAGAPRAGRPGHRSPGARESIRPRTFFTSDRWEVWVGRNNTENDLITHRLSNPHDFWFHVVGVPGSHVILRRPSRNAIPKRHTLEEAAAVAAYFSKARKLSRVPVIYTERKFVSKPRRGKPGQAICTRERELLVRPRIPETNAGHESDSEVSS